MDEIIKFIEEAGHEDVVIFTDFDYKDAFLGLTHDGRAVYDYDLMVQYLVDTEEMTSDDAIEWIEYNTIRSLPYAGPKAPVVLYPFNKDDWKDESHVQDASHDKL